MLFRRFGDEVDQDAGATPIMAHSFLPYFKRIEVMFISCSGYGGAPQFPPLFPYPVLEVNLCRVKKLKITKEIRKNHSKGQCGIPLKRGSRSMLDNRK